MALQTIAPFYKNKNSMGDAILFQNLINKLKEEKDAILDFVTDNKADFSENKDLSSSAILFLKLKPQP
ncbi:hypothetical protein [Bacillus cereus]|uniref:hypothetical protein n=1 Tax=Bacillus cereus TaxID=1396 RepID=UPI001EFAE4F5|nr:hypothetical protein [Bacillus cereus]